MINNNIYFSIIIPTLNEEINLPILLKSIMRNSYEPYEVIVSDSGSKDHTKEEVKKLLSEFKHLHFLEHKSKNVSESRNFGASHAKGEYLIFLDSDVEVSSDFLIGVSKHIKEGNLDALTVWNRAKGNDFIGHILLGMLNTTMSIAQYVKPAANGPIMVIKKSEFIKIQGFDETIVFGEDFDLIQRAVKNRARFRVFTHPIVYVSTRRIEKEGVIVSLYKSLKAIVHQLILGPIRKPIFEYTMGGQYYKKKN